MPQAKAKTNLEVWFAFGFGIVALAVLFAVAILIPGSSENALLITVSRITLAIACAGIAAIIPGFIDLRLKPTTNTIIRAGGAVAVFVLVFFFNPPGLIQSSQDGSLDPIPSTDYMDVVNNWTDLIDSGRIVEAYYSLAKTSQEVYTLEHFRQLFTNYLTPLGGVVKRQLQSTYPAQEIAGERGHFRFVYFITEFENGERHWELIVVKAEDGNWAVRDHSLEKVR